MMDYLTLLTHKPTKSMSDNQMNDVFARGKAVIKGHLVPIAGINIGNEPTDQAFSRKDGAASWICMLSDFGQPVNTYSVFRHTTQLSGYSYAHKVNHIVNKNTSSSEAYWLLKSWVLGTDVGEATRLTNGFAILLQSCLSDADRLRLEEHMRAARGTNDCTTPTTASRSLLREEFVPPRSLQPLSLIIRPENSCNAMFKSYNMEQAKTYDEMVILKSRQSGITTATQDGRDGDYRYFLDTEQGHFEELKAVVNARQKGVKVTFDPQHPIKQSLSACDMVMFPNENKSSGSQQNHNQTKTQGVEMDIRTQENILAKLAKVNTNNDEFEHLTGADELGDDLSKAVAELHVEERAQAVKAAAQLVLAQLNRGKAIIEGLRVQLSHIRNSEKQTIAAIEYAAVAMAYGRETQNFLPLLKLNAVSGSIAHVPAADRVPEEDYKRLILVVRNKQKEAQTAAKTKKAAVKKV